jgi:hypothetical protein
MSRLKKKIGGGLPSSYKYGVSKRHFNKIESFLCYSNNKGSKYKSFFVHYKLSPFLNRLIKQNKRLRGKVHSIKTQNVVVTKNKTQYFSKFNQSLKKKAEVHLIPYYSFQYPGYLYTKPYTRLGIRMGLNIEKISSQLFREGLYEKKRFSNFFSFFYKNCGLLRNLSNYSGQHIFFNFVEKGLRTRLFDSISIKGSGHSNFRKRIITKGNTPRFRLRNLIATKSTTLFNLNYSKDPLGKAWVNPWGIPFTDKSINRKDKISNNISPSNNIMLNGFCLFLKHSVVISKATQTKSGSGFAPANSLYSEKEDSCELFYKKRNKNNLNINNKGPGFFSKGFLVKKRKSSKKKADPLSVLPGLPYIDKSFNCLQYLFRNFIKKSGNIPSCILLIYLNLHFRFFSFYFLIREINIKRLIFFISLSFYKFNMFGDLKKLKSFLRLKDMKRKVQKPFDIKNRPVYLIFNEVLKNRMNIRGFAPSRPCSTQFLGRVTNNKIIANKKFLVWDKIEEEKVYKVARQEEILDKTKEKLWNWNIKNLNRNSLVFIFKKYWLKRNSIQFYLLSQIGKRKSFMQPLFRLNSITALKKKESLFYFRTNKLKIKKLFNLCFFKNTIKQLGGNNIILNLAHHRKTQKDYRTAIIIFKNLRIIKKSIQTKQILLREHLLYRGQEYLGHNKKFKNRKTPQKNGIHNSALFGRYFFLYTYYQQ